MTQVIVPEKKTVAELAELTSDTLYYMQSNIALQAASLKEQAEKLSAALERKYAPRLKQRLAEEEKDTGTVRFDDNGFEIEADVPKKVEWDTNKLREAFNSMAEEDAKHYAKVSLSVEEKKFSAAPPAIRDAFLPARTVKPGKAKFIIHAPKMVDA